jgi:hypothetical protein
MAKLRITKYEVVGSGPFAVDMLRYDASYPERTDDAIAILAQAGFMEQREARRVRLVHRDVYAGWSPTIDRWRSFGWTVDQNTIVSWTS